MSPRYMKGEAMIIKQIYVTTTVIQPHLAQQEEHLRQ